MQLVIEPRKIETNMSDVDDITFSFDQENGVMFNLIRKQIYSDPIGTTVREIMANALDSLREAGRADVPVEVTLPGEYLVIKDTGVGLSPERFRDVYAVYGRSTKSNDNEQQGGFGIGAKSPFSYCDAFTITSVYNGVETHYSVFIDESHKGKIRKIFENPTKDRNGVTVKIPVLPQDRERFKHAVYYFSDFWKVRPKILGGYAREIPKSTVESDNWVIYKPHAPNGCNILVDGIPYRDNQSGIPSGVVLKFDIGQVDLAAHREQLLYSNRTIEAIEAAKTKYTEEIAQKMQSQIDQCESLGEIVKLIQSVPRPYGMSTTWTYKGHSFKYPLENTIRNYCMGYKDRLSDYSTREFRNDTDLSDLAFIFRDKDLTIYDRQRIKQHLKNNPGLKWVYLIEPDQQTLPCIFTQNSLNLSQIKVVRNYVRGPKGSKKKKTNIKIKRRGYSYGSGRKWINYDTSQNEEFLYTTKDLYYVHSVDKLGMELVQIEFKDEATVADNPNFIKLEDFLKESVNDNLSDGEIEEIVKVSQANMEYAKYSFLKGLDPAFDFFDKPGQIKDYEKYEQLISFMVDNHLLKESETPPLPKQFAMLKFVNSLWSEEDQQIVTDYVKTMNKFQKLKEKEAAK